MAALALLGGCGGGGDRQSERAIADRESAFDPLYRAQTQTRDGEPSTPTPLKPPPCPPELSNCARASGTIIYIERIDPDGDGDAHFVLLSNESITAPGVSVVDLRADLRPHPLPGIGEELAAAGPVYTGSYNQRQIEAIAVAVHARQDSNL